MVDENSVNAQQISECAVKPFKSYMSASSQVLMLIQLVLVKYIYILYIYILLDCEGMLHFMTINLCEFIIEWYKPRFYYVHFFYCNLLQVFYFLSYYTVLFIIFFLKQK